MNLYDIYRKSILVACAGLAMQSSGASGVENIEDLWIGGVFDTRIMTPATDVASKLDLSDPMPLTDADGNTNELILMPDYADSSFIRRAVPSVDHGTGRRPEDVLLDAVNGNNAVTLAELGHPTNVRHLIRDRFDETRRIFLTKDDPEERLHRYLVFRYPTINAAKNAEQRLNNIPGITYAGINRMLKYSSTPNDPYFQVKSQPTLFQWGMHTMGFPAAWNRTMGHGYVGVIDSIVSTTHTDISSVRSQLSFTATSPGSPYFFHGQHVTGIIAGSQNNGVGVSGGCPNCSVALGQASPFESGVSEAIFGLVDRGIQTINMSFGKNGETCGNPNNNNNMKAICAAIAYADKYDVLLVAAAGNDNNKDSNGNNMDTPDFPASHASVLSVGGVQSIGGSSTSWAWWSYDATNGSNWAGINGVLAPAKSIVSTVPVGSAYSNLAYQMCGDIAGYDESGVYNDGYGSCTGTSMAAPHITALAGILRSINPRLSANLIKSAIRLSGDRYAVPTKQFGYGVPNAGTAVNNSITNSNPKRLTPLFAFYSNGRQDYFYTTVPQMGAAALNGTLQPGKYPPAGSSQYSAVGRFVNGYSYFPGMGGISPGAQVWIFTTPENPKSATIPLAPLYRLSWKCGDTGISPACAPTNNYHTDFVYIADSSGVSAYLSVGYKLDGIEGYIYPKTITQPVGTVRLMRKYNPVRDDHAIFPESELANMTAQGYTQNSGSDWLGYVYPNANGNMPIY